MNRQTPAATHGTDFAGDGAPLWQATRAAHSDGDDGKDALRTYLDDIGRLPRLTEAEERALGAAVHQGTSELRRAARSLHARLRWVLLQRDDNPLRQAASLWAALAGWDTIVVTDVLRVLLERAAADDSTLLAALDAVTAALPERDQGRGLEGPLCALVQGQAEVVTAVDALLGLGGAGLPFRQGLETLCTQVALVEREVGAGEDADTATDLVPHLEGCPWPDHPLGQATASLLDLGHDAWDYVVTLVQQANGEAVVPTDALARVLQGDEDAICRVLTGWSIDLDLLARAQQARTLLTERNLRLVVSMARRYATDDHALLDLIQDGNLGLIRATELFDPARGYRFSTYAVWWIKQAMLRGRDDSRRTVRLPQHVQQRLRRISAIQDAFTAAHGRAPSQAELAERVGMTVERLAADLLARQPSTSLDAPVGEGDDLAPLGDLVGDPDEPSIESAVSHTFLQRDVSAALATLPERERVVLRLRYGLVPDGRPRSLEEISTQLRISRERVRQIEVRALRELRKHEVRGPLHVYR